MKTLLMVMTVSLSLLTLNSCKSDVTSASDFEQAEATEAALVEANRQVGMPDIKNFQQRKLMKLIFEQCDREDLICYAYLQNITTGKLVFIGKCMGYGIPFSAQFTNPEKIVDGEDYTTNFSGSVAPIAVPQADPNGLFMPTSSSATWLLMIDPVTKKPRPVYFEPTIVVSPFELPAS